MYAGSGVAMETLVESTVRVTIRHSETEPIASEAATAPASPDEATDAGGCSKPVAPGDDFMGRNPSDAGESPATSENFTGTAGNFAAAAGRKTAK